MSDEERAALFKLPEPLLNEMIKETTIVVIINGFETKDLVKLKNSVHELGVIVHNRTNRIYQPLGQTKSNQVWAEQIIGERFTKGLEYIVYFHKSESLLKEDVWITNYGEAVCVEDSEVFNSLSKVLHKSLAIVSKSDDVGACTGARLSLRVIFLLLLLFSMDSPKF